jgi:hypothetical protein
MLDVIEARANLAYVLNVVRGWQIARASRDDPTRTPEYPRFRLDKRFMSVYIDPESILQ